MIFLEHAQQTITKILQKFPAQQRFSLAILQEIQKEYNYISAEHLKTAADYLSLPLSQLFSMATFYKALSLDKKGKFIIRVCDGTACHIRGSQNILGEIERALGIREGETTEDGLFSIEIVNCVGSCAMAPVVICDEDYFGNVAPGGGEQIVETYRKKEAE